MYILQYAKGTSRAEVTSNSEKIMPVALAIIIIELRLSEGISQSEKIPLDNLKNKSHNNLLKGFQVDLKEDLFGF